MKFNQEIPPRIVRRARHGTDKFILVRDHRVHYVEEGEGEPVVLIPGSQSTRRLWNRLAPLLARAYRVVQVEDLQAVFAGKAREKTAPGGEEQADLLAEMVRQMGLARVALIGSGGGAGTALGFAARHPELTGKIISLGGHISQPEGDPRDTKKMRRKASAAGGSLRVEDLLKEIKAPVLYVYGSNPTTTPPSAIGSASGLQKDLELLHNCLPRAWIVSLEGGIFESALNNAQELADIVLEFLRSKS